MKLVVLTCLDPSKVGQTTNRCPSSKRRWAEIDIPESNFWTDLITTYSPDHFWLIILGSMTALAIGFGGGMMLNAVRKGKNFW